MIGLHNIYQHIHLYGRQHRQIYAVSLMLFFWAVFDGIFSFITPLYITQKGISEGMMGIIIGTSSVAGILFDIILCRVLKDFRFRVIYFLMFITCFIYPLILYQGSSAIIFIMAMAMWGLYYDLVNLGNIDFVTRTSEQKEYSTNFGILRIFFDLGYLIAPLITGLMISELIDFKPFLAAWIFLVFALLCYFLVLFLTKNIKNGYHASHRRGAITIFKELVLWKKIGKYIMPILLVSLMLNIIDAVYWTIGPLLSESNNFLGDFGGLFMTVYILPPLFIGWFLGGITSKMGKKRTSFLALLVGAFFLFLFSFFKEPLMLVLLSFLSSFFTSFASPALIATFADYVTESPELEKEIITMQDSFTNLGYIIGPILAGFAGQYLGYLTTFSILGLLGMIMSFVLLKITPSQINIKVRV